MSRTALAAAAPAVRALALAIVPPAHLAPGAVRANPATYVATPGITEGEKAVELLFGATRSRSGESATGNAFAFEVAPRAWWAIELKLKGRREAGERYGYDAWEIENRFALFEPGRFPVDLGFLLEVEHPKDRDEGWEVTWGPLLQSQWGALQGNLNLLFTRHLRAAAPEAAAFNYQWQLRWRADPRLDWGAQGFGETGPWRNWAAKAEQSHQIGPALFGRIKLERGAALKYDAAVLFGTGGEAPTRALRARLEVEFF